MPRISSRNGKELPNYNEAEAFDFSDEESEGEYVSAKQKRINDRESLFKRMGRAVLGSVEADWVANRRCRA